MMTKKQLKQRIEDIVTGVYGWPFDEEEGSIMSKAGAQEFADLLIAIQRAFGLDEKTWLRLDQIRHFDTPESIADFLHPRLPK